MNSGGGRISATTALVFPKTEGVNAYKLLTALVVPRPSIWPITRPNSGM